MTSHGPPVHYRHATINPWGGPDTSSSASGSSRTYHCPADCYIQQEPALYSQPARTPSPHYDIIEGPRLNRGAVISRPVSAASTARTEGAVDPCGGHCKAFEQFCHYCLQVVFIAGILTGISLTIAGSLLRSHQRGGDLMVLIYIGCLTAMVCGLLLSVQCCVSRNVDRRKRARRNHPIPLQDLGPTPLGPPRLPAPGQYEPLLRQLVQQQIEQTHPAPTTSIVRGDRSGTPWWRRQPPHQATKLPHTRLQRPL